MKRQIIAILIASFIIGNTSQVLSNPFDQSTPSLTKEVSFSASSFSTTVKEGYTSIFIPESTGSIITPGHPELPKITQTIILPFGSTIESIDHKSECKDQTFTLDEKIIPVSYPDPLDPNIQIMEKRPINEHIYTSPALYPTSSIDSAFSAGLIQNELVNILSLTWYPITYSPLNDEISFSQDLTFTITYRPARGPLYENSENDLVIIGPQEFADAAQRLVNHKNNHGMQTTFTSVEYIYQNYEGRDYAEQIKYYLYETVKNLGTNYVLLLGNIDFTPMRRSAIRVYHDDDLLTDLYYADLFESDGGFSCWDPNNNDRFSEYNWNDGLLEEIDLYPDVHVGRIPCKSVRELNTVIDKIIHYERNAKSSSWYHKIILMAGNTFPNRDILEGEIVTQHIAVTMENHGFEPIKLWTSLGNYNPLTINKEITKGAGFISYSGHGYEQGFGTSPPGEEGRIEYYSPYLIGLFNGYKLPVLFFDACSTTKLDFTVEELHEWYPTPLVRFFSFLHGVSYEMNSYYPTISWELVKKPNGGTIATIGATRVAFTGVNQNGAYWGAGFLNDHFFEAYEPRARLGELYTQCQIDYLDIVGPECITLQEFILVGDPSLTLGGYS